VTVPITPAQKAALTSIVYNVGAGRGASGSDPGRDGIVTLANGKPSTLLTKLNSADYAGAADQFLVWNKSGGVVLAGLFAWGKKKEADARVAQAEAGAAQARQETAEVKAAVEQGNATAAQAGEQAVANRARADEAAARLPDDELDAALRRRGALREDDPK
jgi:hypothetical protein